MTSDSGPAAAKFPAHDASTRAFEEYYIIGGMLQLGPPPFCMSGLPFQLQLHTWIQ